MRRGLLLLIAVLVSGCWIPREKRATALSDLKILEAASKLFYFDNKRWPNSLDELTEPSATKDEILIALPRDPWGRSYEYSLTKPEICDEDRPFYVWTYGSDGEPGGSDDAADIGNWLIDD